MNYKITSPCTQDWNKMEKIENGRFCEVCNKTVHDLTLNKDFAPPPGTESFCGRMIDEASDIPKKINFSKLIFWQRIIRLSPIIASLFIGKAGIAQVKDSVVSNKEMIKINSHETEINGKIVLSGKIRDTVKLEGVPFANVVIADNGIQIGGGNTDYDGNFLVVLDTSEIKGKTFDVKVFSVGYSPLILTGIPKCNKEFLLDLKISYCMRQITGVIYVGKYSDFTLEPIPTGQTFDEEDIKHSPR